MKKCMICVVLLCLILIGCAAVTNQPTTEPQLKASTTTGTVPTAQPTAPTAVPATVPKSQLVRVRVGDQCVVPISVVTGAKTYWEEYGEWATLGCGPILFEKFDDSQIPTLSLTAPVQLELADNVDKNVGLWAQTDKKAYTGTHTTLEGLSNLTPGEYYIRISICARGKYVAGDYETTNYQLGFKLIVP